MNSSPQSSKKGTSVRLESWAESSKARKTSASTLAIAVAAPNLVQRLSRSSQAVSQLELDDWSEEFPLEIKTPKKNISVSSDQYRNINHFENVRLSNRGKETAINRGLMEGTFYDPPSIHNNLLAKPSLKRKMAEQHTFDGESFEDGFEGDAFRDGLLEKLVKFQKKHEPPIDEDLDKVWSEESTFNVTTTSKGSNISLLSGSTNNESSSNDTVLDGLVLPDTNLDFKATLKRKQQENNEKAMLESMQLRNASGSTGSIHSNKSSNETIGENDESFLDGFDLGGDELLKVGSHDTLHHNVKVQRRNVKRTQQTTSYSGSLKKADSDNLDDCVSGSRTAANAVHRLKESSSFDSLSLKACSKISTPALRAPKSTVSMPQSSNEAILELARIRRESGPQPKSQPQLAPGASPKKKTKIHSLNISLVQSISKRRPQSLAIAQRRVISDGTELDSLEDLPTNSSREPLHTIRAGSTSKMKRYPLESYMEKPVRRTVRPKRAVSPFQSTNNSRTSRRDHKLGLIQQFSSPVTTVVKGYNGTMHFNATKCRWEGNNEDLKRFDNVPKGPGLIAYISNKGIQVVGNMVFDPVNMKWINVNQEVPEEDPFQDVDDLEIKSPVKKNPSVGYKAQPHNSTVNLSDPEFIYDAPNPIQGTKSLLTISSAIVNDEYTVGQEFDLSDEIIKRFEDEDKRWKYKTRGWFPEEVFSRDYLVEIRSMVMRKS